MCLLCILIGMLAVDDFLFDECPFDEFEFDEFCSSTSLAIISIERVWKVTVRVCANSSKERNNLLEFWSFICPNHHTWCYVQTFVWRS